MFVAQKPWPMLIHEWAVVVSGGSAIFVPWRPRQMLVRESAGQVPS